MSQDGRLLRALSLELGAMGYSVFCARDFEEVAYLVRRGLSRRFVLVSVGGDLLSPAELRRALAARLPDWSIRTDDVVVPRGRGDERQPPN